LRGPLAEVLVLKCYEEVPNAGDRFGRILAGRRWGEPVTTAGEPPLDVPNLILLGSLLHWADRNSVVCGAGLLAPNLRPPAVPAAITCVRGPLTAEALRRSGFECPDVFGDPGILACELFPDVFAPDVGVGIVPHYVDADEDWVQQCRARGFLVLDVGAPVDAYLKALQRCEVVLSSSLHGLVFAHAYGRRALWIELSDRVHGDGFKFYDYYSSIGVAADAVVRLRVSADLDPFKAAELARPGQHAHMISGLKDAMARAFDLIAEAGAGA
jgi:pyruvyltransferase